MAANGLIARMIALAVMILSAAVIAWHHRADILPSAVEPANPAVAAYRACIDARRGEIEAMQADGIVDENRAALFLSRAEAFCRSEAEKSTQ